MENEKSNLLSAGAIAKELGVSSSKISKIIKSLDLKPEMKKGNCGYYSKEAVVKIKETL